MKNLVLKKWGIVFSVAFLSVLTFVNMPICVRAEEEQNLIEKKYFLDNDDLYDQYVDHLMDSEDGVTIEEYNDSDVDTGYYAAKSKLTKYGKTVYELFKEQIIKISNGECESALIEIPYDSIYGADETFTFTASELNMTQITDENSREAVDKVNNLISNNAIEPGFGNVYDAIVTDVPYYLYWSSGYVTYTTPVVQEVSHTNDSITVKPRVGNQKISYNISVSSTYANSDNQVDTSKTSVAKNAFNNASELVNQARSMTDLEKLKFYKNSICDLTDYAFNTWIGSDQRQIIHVFDQDNATKVVCEGYAKAFKYLCDLTSFSSAEVECRLATGYLKVDEGGYEPHMWNIVQLRNNENYLVDVTNCDDGMFGSPDILYMKGESGKVNQVIDGNQTWGYQIAHPSNTVFYYYDSSNYNNMRSESELTLVNSQQSDPQPDPQTDPQPDPQPDQQDSVATVMMYRLYNPNSGEHFYTGSIEERTNLVNAGWNWEGNGWEAPVSGGYPVYRLYNPNAGDHHYTNSDEEKNNLIAVGWNYEGIAWNSAYPNNKPLYRLYNPNAQSGSHHYTMSAEEKANLEAVGWNYEGIGWFGQ